MASSLTAQSVTRLIRNMQAGRDSAAGVLLEAYFQRLVQLVRKRLQTMPGLDGYEEDVALQSFDSMCRRLRCAERPVNLSSRDDFWRVTVHPGEGWLRRPSLVLPFHSIATFVCRLRPGLHQRFGWTGPDLKSRVRIGRRPSPMPKPRRDRLRSGATHRRAFSCGG